MLKDFKTAKLRLLQMHYEAGVGHIGGNLSCLEILYTLQETMKDCDQLVLSKGHAAGAYYVTQWAAGADIDLTTFHQDGTELAGHLLNTGSLGHGLGLAAGYALHKKLWDEPGTVYCVMSDGEWDEGSNWEALEFAASNQLYNHMKIIVDCNGWKGFGEAQSRRMLRHKMESYCSGIAIPTLGRHPLNFHGSAFISLVATVKGQSISFLEDRMESHYDPLTKEQYELAVKEVSSAENVC